MRINLENELRQFVNDRDLAGNMIVAWNFEEFEVTYQVSRFVSFSFEKKIKFRNFLQCLADEIQIGDYYIRLILEKDDWPQNLVKDP